MARPREFDEQSVVRAATAVFWERGYRRTSPKDLLEATGLSKSSLYNTFGSKQGLFERALNRYVDDQAARMSALLDSGPLRDVLPLMYEGIVAGVTAEQGPRGCLVCTASLDVDPADGPLHERVGEARERMVAVFAARFRRARAEGELAPERDPEAVARFVFGVNNGMMVLGRSGMPADELRLVAGEAVQAVCG